MDIQQGSRTVKSLIRSWGDGDIQLPPFQRPYVWQIRKTLNLLDSLYRPYPIGAIYLWRPAEKSKLRPKRRPDGHNRLDFTHYVIDGQQRLTSLAAAFGLSEMYHETNKRSLECSLELTTDEAEGDGTRLTRLFHSPANKNEKEGPELKDAPSRVRLRDLLGGESLERLRERKKSELKDAGHTNKEVEKATKRIDQAAHILDRLVPIFIIEDAKDEEVVAMFKRLNGGAGLRRGDIQAADLGRGPTVTVLEKMRDFVGEHDGTGRVAQIGFNFGFAFRALVVFHTGNAQLGKDTREDWAAPRHGHKLMSSWVRAQRSLAKAIEFVDVELGWSRRALLPSANALIPMAVALDKAGNKIIKRDRLSYKQWLCLTALRGVFGGSVETTINHFVRAVNKPGGVPSERLLTALAKANRRPVTAFELLQEGTSTWGGGTQVLLAYLVQQKARDWANGSKPLRDLAKAGLPGSRTGSLSVHHILARELAESRDAAPGEVNCVANYAILSGDTNSGFRHEAPEVVFGSKLTRSQANHAAVQFFDKRAVDLLKNDGYEAFRKDRAKRLAAALNKWLQLGR
jgi:hypothetical protein